MSSKSLCYSLEITSQKQDEITYTAAFSDLFFRYLPSSISLYVEYLTIFFNVLIISTLDDPLILSSTGLATILFNVVVSSIDVGL
jgi:hypothetical protein